MSKSKNNIKRNNRLNIRLSDEELKEIEEMSKIEGHTIAEQFRKCAFAKKHPQPIISNEDTRKILIAQHEINLGVAKLRDILEHGFADGWQQKLSALEDLSRMVTKYIGGFRGVASS